MHLVCAARTRSLRCVAPSTKGLLPILWSLFPHHPNLLPAYWTKAEAEAALGKHFVEKPLLGREGQNVSIHAEQGLFTRGGEYADTGFIYQQVRGFSHYVGVLCAVLCAACWCFLCVAFRLCVASSPYSE